MGAARKVSGLLCCIALLAGAHDAGAQVSVGVFGGISHFSVDQAEERAGVELSYRTGLSLGGLLNMRLNEMTSLQLEPMFVHKGSIATVEGFGEVDVEASYFEVPLVAKYEFGTARLRPYLMAGPSVGYLLSATQEADFIPESAQDIEDQSETWEFAVTGGAGLQYGLAGAATGFVQGRYYHGLTDTHAEEQNHKSRGYKVVVGVSFPLSR